MTITVKAPRRRRLVRTAVCTLSAGVAAATLAATAMAAGISEDPGSPPPEESSVSVLESVEEGFSEGVVPHGDPSEDPLESLPEKSTSPEGTDGSPENNPTSEEEIYNDQSHFDEEVFVDPDTGERTILRSGITHYEDAPGKTPMSRMLRSIAPLSTVSYADIFPSVTLLDFPAGGTVSSETPLAVTMVIHVPDNAQPGDVYSVTAPLPFGFANNGANREIKDSSGKVFAVTKVGEGTDGVPGAAFKTLNVILTDEVAGHVAIEGFIELQIKTANKNTLKTYTFNILGADGTLLGPNATVKIPGQDNQTNDFVPGSGTATGNLPSVSPALKVAPPQMKNGLKVTFASGSPGLQYGGCERPSVIFEGFRADGFYERRSLGKISAIPGASCSVSSDNLSATLTFAQAVATPTDVPSGTFRIEAGPFFGEASKSYPFKITTNWNAPGRDLQWQGTVTTGTPSGAGATHLSLTTKKSATFTTQESNSKPTLGDTITYTITTKPGADNSRAVNNVVTTDVLPAGLQLLSVTNGGSYNSATREIVWGPRILTSTGSFTDVVVAKVVSIPASGSLVNTVENIADSVCTNNDEVSVCKSHVTTPIGTPSFQFVKHSKVTFAENDRGFDGAIAGDKITYWFTAKNTGDVALTTLKIDDELLGLSAVECLAPQSSLLPGESVECVKRYTHTITKSDQTSGKVVNQAIGNVPGLPPATSTTTDLTIDPKYQFSKRVVEIKDDSGKKINDGKAMTGYVIHYGFTAKNTGNVDLKTLRVSDPLLGAKTVECLAPGTVLKPGKTVNCVDNPAYFYTVTKADAATGLVHNVATGSVPGLPDQEDETETPVLPDPVIPDLPHTGAGGVAIPIAAGTLLLVGAGVVLIPRQRASKHVQNILH